MPAITLDCGFYVFIEEFFDLGFCFGLISYRDGLCWLALFIQRFRYHRSAGVDELADSFFQLGRNFVPLLVWFLCDGHKVIGDKDTAYKRNVKEHLRQLGLGGRLLAAIFCHKVWQQVHIGHELLALRVWSALHIYF